MSLSASQIQQLYTFTEKHYVEWYDVQTELVDHLANGIETQLQQHPKITFDEALHIEFKKFGVCGFGDVVIEKTKAINKHYWLQIWHCFKAFFTLPKLVFTCVLIWMYFEILNFSMNYHVNWVLIPTLTVLFGLPWYIFISNFKRNKRITQQTGKKWLFEHTVSQLGGLVHLVNMAVYLQVLYQTPASWSFLMTIIFSVMVISFSLVLYIAIYVVTPKLRKSMALQHPEYIIT